MTDLEEQPFPSESKCPECGGEPTAESKASHLLSVNGYLHDDRHVKCEDCGNDWQVGIPVGDGPKNDKLWCDSCDDEWMLIHRFDLDRSEDIPYVKLHLKCPNCYYFKRTDKHMLDSDGIALTAYPPITGDVGGADEFGWDKGDVPWDEE